MIPGLALGLAIGFLAGWAWALWREVKRARARAVEMEALVEMIERATVPDLVAFSGKFEEVDERS